MKKSEKYNIKGKILTTNYLHFTELKSIEFLKRFKNIEGKFFDSDKMEGVHTKGYIFEYENYFMKDVTLICNYQMKHSSIRGTRLFANGNNHFLFVDLHKDADVKESIKYS